MMSIGRDGEFDAAFSGGTRAEGRIKSRRSGLAFTSSQTSRSAAFRGNRIEIKRERVALQQKAAGGMSHDTKRRRFQRPE